jgi:hypothetical protein
MAWRGLTASGSCVLSEAERRSDHDRYSEWKVLGITIVHLGTNRVDTRCYPVAHVFHRR